MYIARLCVVLITLIAAASAPKLARAENQPDPALEKEAQLIFSAVMSPCCAGKLLSDCPSGAASELKNEIRQKILDGESPEQVREYLFALYGDSISAVPRNRGFGRLAWLTPFAFTACGLLLLVLFLKRTKTPEQNSGLAVEIDPELEARIQAEIDS